MATKSPKNIVGQLMAKAAVTGIGERYAPMKRGVYLLNLERAELKPNKSGTGYVVSIGATTTTGRWVWANLNISNPNPEAERIGNQQFNALLEQLSMSQEEFVDFDDFPTKLQGHQVAAYVSVDDRGQNVISNFKQKVAEAPF